MERIARSDVGRFAHLWLRNGNGVGGEPREGPCRLTVKTWHDADEMVVALAGEFDLAAAEPVRHVLTRAIREPRQRLIVDLSRLTFIDSSGLHTILDAYACCRDAGPALIIRPGPPNVRRVFELTNTIDYLPFVSAR